MIKFIIIIFTTLFVGCSELDWVRYVELQDDSTWHTSGQRRVGRSLGFTQSGFQYDIEGLSITVRPEPLRSYVVLIGPPFVPIIPFIPIYLFPDNDLLQIEITIKDSQGDKILNLKEFQFHTLQDSSNDSFDIFIQKDSLQYTVWRRINLNLKDSSQYLLQCSNKPIALKFISKSPISKIDKMSIILNGIRKEEKSLHVPSLILIRRGKFYYEPMTAA